MFNHIVLRRSREGNSITAGQIAEALLYYQQIHLIIDQGTISNLAKKISLNGVLNLIRRPEVTAVYCEEMLATNTSTHANTQFHSYIAFMVAGFEQKNLNTPAERLEFDLVRQGLEIKEVRKFVKEFLKLVPVKNFSSDYYISGGIPDAAQKDFLDVPYIRTALKEALSNTQGGYELSHDFKFEVINSNQGFCIFTDIDFQLINQRRLNYQYPLEPLTLAHLLSNILDSRADLVLASHYGGDFITSNLNSSIIKVQHEELLRRTNLNIETQKQFTELTLPNTPTLAEVIDSGERTFDEFLRLLDRSTRFKDWLGTVNPDESLIHRYLKDVSSEGWIERLPSKSVRYVLTSAIAASNPIAGTVSGLFDTFLMDKIFAGWRPNHFISKRLSTFVNAK
jgi:hypothetical protein